MKLPVPETRSEKWAQLCQLGRYSIFCYPSSGSSLFRHSRSCGFEKPVGAEAVPKVYPTSPPMNTPNGVTFSTPFDSGFHGGSVRLLDFILANQRPSSQYSRFKTRNMRTACTKCDINHFLRGRLEKAGPLRILYAKKHLKVSLRDARCELAFCTAQGALSCV